MLADDRIEVVSPGGLPSSITAEEYLSSKLSALRNRNLANVFYRLGFVEIFETEIIRIKPLYTEGLMKPDFEVSKNAIKIITIQSHSQNRFFEAFLLLMMASRHMDL